MKYLNLITLIIIILFSSCQKTVFDNKKDLLNWIEQEKNGLVKTKYINGIMLKIKYLPPLYNVSKDFPQFTTQQIDSVVNIRKNYYTFLLTLGADQRKEKGLDIMYKNIKSFQDYQERIYAMNFKMQHIISLQTSTGSYPPVITNFENNYGLKNQRDFVIVFSPKNENDRTFKNLDKIEILFEDIFFDTGRNYFLFNYDDIETANKIKFKKSN